MIFHVLCYSPEILDHYENPRTQGSLDKSSKNVGTGLVGAPACGDVMKRQVSWGYSIFETLEARLYMLQGSYHSLWI